MSDVKAERSVRDFAMEAIRCIEESDSNEERGRYALPAAMVVVRDWLKTNNSDDSDLITADWLTSAGFTVFDSEFINASHQLAETSRLLRVCGPYTDGIRAWIVAPLFGDDVVISLPNPKTRGDVRNLCRELGISLENKA